MLQNFILMDVSSYRHITAIDRHTLLIVHSVSVSVCKTLIDGLS